jgi:hypothetical protein
MRLLRIRRTPRAEVLPAAVHAAGWRYRTLPAVVPGAFCVSGRRAAGAREGSGGAKMRAAAVRGAGAGA